MPNNFTENLVDYFKDHKSEIEAQIFEARKRIATELIVNKVRFDLKMTKNWSSSELDDLLLLEAAAKQFVPEAAPSPAKSNLYPRKTNAK